MPTVLMIKGFRFFFYAEEGNEPVHVHVAKGDGEGKIWLLPEIKVHIFSGFKPQQQKEIMEIIHHNHKLLINKWNEFFKNK